MIAKQEIKTNCYLTKIDNFSRRHGQPLRQLFMRWLENKKGALNMKKMSSVRSDDVPVREGGIRECKSILRWLINICYYN